MDGKAELQMLSFQAPKIRLLRSLYIEGSGGMQVLVLILLIVFSGWFETLTIVESYKYLGFLWISSPTVDGSDILCYLFDFSVVKINK